MCLTPFCSIRYNDIGVEGAKHIAEGLKENTALTELEYVAHSLLAVLYQLECRFVLAFCQKASAALDV